MTRNPYYRRKSEDGLFTSVKRLFVTAALVCAIGYAGAKIELDQKVDALIYGQKPIAEGYAPATLARKVNPDGKVEIYVSTGEGDSQHELPLLKGIKGPQVGTIDYLIASIDVNQLTPQQALDYSKSLLGKTDPHDQMSYARAAWDNLEPKQRYEFLRNEVERAFQR